ncbi:hypothetical protein MN0502_17510 [Arthrobacter sp. MN05-02]|nr:hypothetical protein MN0502_17510 [Arthrobacter sp. MN05-02]
MSDRSTTPGRHTAPAIAALVSEVFAPAVLVSVFLVVATVGAVAPPQAVAYAAVAVTFTTALPLAGVLVLVRRGHVSDHHISDRHQRAPVLGGALVSITAGLALLVLLGAPWAVTGTVLCTVGGVLAVLVVNLWWKLSAHAAVATFVTLGTIALFGAWATPLVLLPATVGWSRVELGAHTPAQVAAGCVVGAGIGAVFALYVAVP